MQQLTGANPSGFYGAPPADLWCRVIKRGHWTRSSARAQAGYEMMLLLIALRWVSSNKLSTPL